MKEVTKEEFFATLYADKRDIMPTIVSSWHEKHGYTSEWRANGRELFGVSTSQTVYAKATYKLNN